MLVEGVEELGTGQSELSAGAIHLVLLVVGLSEGNCGHCDTFVEVGGGVEVRRRGQSGKVGALCRTLGIGRWMETVLLIKQLFFQDFFFNLVLFMTLVEPLNSRERVLTIRRLTSLLLKSYSSGKDLAD